MNLRVRLRTGGRFCTAAPWAGVHPAALNQSGNLHSHLSKSGQTLGKNGLLRSPGGQQTEPPVGDVLHSSTEDRRFLSGLKRRQLGSLEFSPDGIARVLSFCPRWLRITPRKDLQTHDGHKGFRKLRTTFKAGRRWTARRVSTTLRQVFAKFSEFFMCWGFPQKNFAPGSPRSDDFQLGGLTVSPLLSFFKRISHFQS